jgi:hypothetical protein
MPTEKTGGVAITWSQCAVLRHQSQPYYNGSRYRSKRPAQRGVGAWSLMVDNPDAKGFEKRGKREHGSKHDEAL